MWNHDVRSNMFKRMIPLTSSNRWMFLCAVTHQSTAHIAVMKLCTKDVDMFLHFQAFLQADSGMGSLLMPAFISRKNPMELPVVKITELNSMVQMFVYGQQLSSDVVVYKRSGACDGGLTDAQTTVSYLFATTETVTLTQYFQILLVTRHWTVRRTKKTLSFRLTSKVTEKAWMRSVNPTECLCFSVIMLTQKEQV